MRFPPPLILAIVLAGCADATMPTMPTTHAGPPAHLLLVAGDEQEGTVGRELPDPLVVRVTDADGQPVAGQVVNFRVTAGGGQAFAGVSITDDSGRARERWTLGPVAADTQRLEARAVDTETGAALVFATFTALGTADVAVTARIVPAAAADSARLIGADTLLPGDSVQLAVIAVDRYGNPGTGEATWSSSDSSVLSVTAGGLARAGAAGAAIIFARVDTVLAARAFAVRPRLPAALQLVRGAGQADTVDAVLAESVVVRAVNARGEPFAGATVVFRGLNSAPSDTIPGCSCAVVTTDGQGLAATRWMLGRVAGPAMLRATASNAGAPFDSLAVAATVAPGAAASLSAVGPTTTAGAMLVAVRDRYGNPVAGTSVLWAVVSGIATPVPSVSLSNSAGLAGSTALNATGTAVILASAAGLAGSPVAFTVTAPAPGSGFGLDFQQSWVTVPDHPDLDLDSTWTIEAWVRPRTFGAYQHVLSKWNGGGDASWTLEIGPSGTLRSAIHDGINPTQAVESFAVLTPGVWHHVAITLDRTVLTLYVDGVADRVFSGSIRPMNSTRPLSFGREGPPNPGWHYDGALDDVRIWRVARSAAEIAAYRSATLTGNEPGLVAWWRFDEGSGDYVLDATGRGHTGMLGAWLGTDGNDPAWLIGGRP